jgi:hypothetical protein
MWTMMFVVALAAEAQGPSLPSWMAGCWESRSESVWVEECWTGPRAGIMLGSGRSGKGEQLFNWEVMQIEKTPTDDPAGSKLTFYGAPSGKVRTPFHWVASSEKDVTFLNAEHDFPQRVRYWREGRELVAEISLKDGTKAQRWRYVPQGN